MTEIAALQDGEFLNSAVTIPCCGMIFGIAREEAWEAGRFAVSPLKRTPTRINGNDYARRYGR